MINIKNVIRIAFRVFLYGFSTVGVIFVGVYIAMHFGLLNVKGSVSERNSYFNIKNFYNKNKIEINDLTIACQINALAKYAPTTAINIYKTLGRGASVPLLSNMIETASKRFTNDQAFNLVMSKCNESQPESINLPMSAYNWADTDEWNLMKEVFTRDQEIINKAARDAKISSRIILSGVIGEQFRFFNNRRESFKNYFEPLKILASLSNTSYGIAGLKPKTVLQIETHLKDRNSPFYLGPDMENIVDYKNLENIESERLSRITNSKDPYYSYLYVGLFMKQIERQWENAGYDIRSRPDIFATLYNLGFYYSVPKSDPKAGGALLTIGGANYTFGDLGYEFYYSGELSNIFPLDVQ